MDAGAVGEGKLFGGVMPVCRDTGPGPTVRQGRALVVDGVVGEGVRLAGVPCGVGSLLVVGPAAGLPWARPGDITAKECLPVILLTLVRDAV